MNTRNYWILAATFGVVLMSSDASAEEKLNPRTLCPQSGSVGQSILLIDTTDPLGKVAFAHLTQLLTAFYTPDNKHYLQRGEELIVYRMTPHLSKSSQICNPGNPKDRSWTENLLDSKTKARLNWRRFIKTIQRSRPKFDEQVKGDKSPLLENISAVAADHIPSIGVGENRKPTRLFLFSDMLQHSDLLSHYKFLPDMEQFKRLTGYAAMKSDLRGVRIWIFYAQRTKLETKQTFQHYRWWSRALKMFGGRIEEMTPFSGHVEKNTP